MANPSRYRPTKEELDRIGAVQDERPYGNPRTDCGRCNGTGFVKTPSRLRGGHVCPCTLDQPNFPRNEATMKTITCRAKAFSGRGVETIRCTVDPDGTVRVWDSVAGHYTACHILGRSALARIRRLFAAE